MLTAVSYERVYNNKKAEKYYLLCISVSKKNNTLNNNYALSCNNIAAIYKKHANYKKAEPLFIEAKAINYKLYGSESEGYTAVCNNLADLYNKIGEYKKAEPLYLEALRIDKKRFGASHPYYAIDCNNLGILYKDMHNYQDAEKLLVEAKI